MKKGLFAILTLVLLSLTACGKEAEEPDRYGGIRYLPVFRELDVDLDEIRSGCVMGDYVYLTGSVTTNEDYYDREARLLRVPLDGGEIVSLPGCGAASGDQNVIYSSEGIAVAAGEEDTLWLLEKMGSWTYDFPEGFDPYDISQGTRGQYYLSSESSYILHRLDGNGNELSRQEWPRKDLEDRLGMEFIDDVYIGPGGEITFWNRYEKESLVTMDQTGEVLGRVAKEDQNQNWNGAVRLGDGRLAVWSSNYKSGSYHTDLQALSRKGDAWEESWELPEFTTVYDGDGNHLFYYNAGSDLLAWRESTPAEDGQPEENTPLLSWVNTGLDGGGDRSVCTFLPDGRLVLVQGGGRWSTSDMAAELAVLTPTDNPPERTVLTLGTAQLFSGLEETVRKFNRASHDYCIEVREYMDFDAGESWEEAQTRLATEVGAGRMPDILDVRNMPVARWAANGLLEDLWPWIDRDSEIDREDLMERVFEAASIGGKLYEVGNSFCIQTVVGAQDVVGERMSWTPEEMWEALAAMPEGCDAMDSGSADMLCDMLRLNWDRFVDWEKGQCHFDSEEFRSLLEYCDRFPAERASGSRLSRVMDRQQMLLDTSIRSFEQLQEFRTFFGGQVSFVGYPNDWGEAGSRFQLSEGCAMTSACRDKEGAWTFLRTLLLPRNRADTFRTAFSTNREDFQRLMEEAMKQREVGRVMDYGDVKIRYRPAKQADCDQIMALYNASEGIYRDDRALTDIIYDIAGACFAGDKSVEETMELIQNRAELYVSEQT